MPAPDPRFSMANERTYLAWVRTSLALLAGGLVAAKAIDFEHELLRWAVAVPPVVLAALVALVAPRRWRAYEAAMADGRPLPVGGGLRTGGLLLAGYALLVLAVLVLDEL